MNNFKKNLNKLTKQELINLCVVIKKSNEQKTEIIRGLENDIKDGCTCTEPRNFYGNGVVIICKNCGLAVVDRREEYKTNKPEKLKFESVEDENGFI